MSETLKVKKVKRKTQGEKLSKLDEALKPALEEPQIKPIELPPQIKPIYDRHVKEIMHYKPYSPRLEEKDKEDIAKWVERAFAIRHRKEKPPEGSIDIKTVPEEIKEQALEHWKDVNAHDLQEKEIIDESWDILEDEQ